MWKQALSNRWASPVGATILAIVFLAILAIGSAFGPDFSQKFINGPAAGWVQAIGSIAAIVGSYHLGARNFEQAQIQKELDGLLTSKHKHVVLLGILRLTETTNGAVIALCNSPVEGWGTMAAMGDELLEQCASVPLFEVATSEQIWHIQRVRQIARTYIGYASIGRARLVQPSEKEAWAEFALGNVSQIEGFIKSTTEAIHRLEAVIATLRAR